MSKTITSASYSKLIDFESCRFKAYLKHAARIPDPKPSPSADRGTDIHNRTELWLRGQGEAPLEAKKHFSDELESLKNHFNAGRVSLEGEWAFNHDWEPAPWKTGWFRLKADAVCHITKDHAVVIDYKTGKVKPDKTQLQLNAAAVFAHHPNVHKIGAAFWRQFSDTTDLHSHR
jgi:hypothetical protein